MRLEIRILQIECMFVRMNICQTFQFCFRQKTENVKNYLNAKVKEYYTDEYVRECLQKCRCKRVLEETI